MGVPIQGLTLDLVVTSPKIVSDPSPFSPLDLDLWIYLSYFWPCLLVWDDVIPAFSQDDSEESINCITDIVRQICCHSPCLGSIEALSRHFILESSTLISKLFVAALASRILVSTSHSEHRLVEKALRRCGRSFGLALCLHVRRRVPYFLDQHNQEEHWR